MSIFIWKAPECISTSNTIDVYIGSSWSLEIGHNHRLNYERINQHTYDGLIVFSIEEHQTDCVGRYLLEKQKVPYRFIKKDKDGGIYEQMGEWIRYRSMTHFDYDSVCMEQECKRIKYNLGE